MTHAQHSRAPSAAAARLVALTGVAVALALAGCASDDDAASSAATAPASAGERPAATIQEQTAGTTAEAQVEGASADGGGTDSSGIQSLAVGVRSDRLLAVDVTAMVEVADVSAAVDRVIGVASVHGGQVYGSDVQLTDPASATATLVVKLPPAEVEGAIDDLAAIGRLTGRQQATEDVTDRMTDLGTRIATARQSVERVQLLLSDADDLGQVVMLESELTSRQTVLEELLAQQANVGARAALATLTVQLSTAPVEEAIVTTTTVAAGDTGVGDAFAAGGRAFVSTAEVVLVAFGFAAPFLACGAAIALLVWMRTRRRTRRTPPLAPPTGAAP